MCIGGGPDIPKAAPIPPPPTVANTGDNESVAANRSKDRQKQRTAAGYQQNILNGQSDNSDTNVQKKTLLG